MPISLSTDDTMQKIQSLKQISIHNTMLSVSVPCSSWYCDTYSVSSLGHWGPFPFQVVMRIKNYMAGFRSRAVSYYRSSWTNNLL